MPSSNILLFDANKANMMSDEQYNTNTQRLNGVQSGIASSQLQNKTLYQVSLVAYAIAQIMNQNGLDANDTAAVSAFVANLSGTMLQKVADLATTQEAQAGVATGKWMSPALVRAAMDTYTSGKWLPLSGGTMKGNLILNADPTVNLGAATKQYVDKSFNSLRKRRRLFTQTKTYNNFTSGAPAIDLLFTLPQMSYKEIGFYPTKMFVELSAQNYSASNGVSLVLSKDGYSQNVIKLDLPSTAYDTVVIDNFYISTLYYIFIQMNRVQTNNSVYFETLYEMLYNSQYSAAFDNSCGFYLYHYNVNGTITSTVWLS